MSQALAEAPKLLPEIRLAQAISSFSASLDETRRATFTNHQTQGPPTAATVIRLTEEINRDGSRVHRAWRPYATRLIPLLEKVRIFGKAGDILVGGSASGVWAAMRISLEDAISTLSLFERLSLVFMRLGRCSDIQQDIVSLFPDCKELQEDMCEYLIVILRFCQRIVVYRQKSLHRKLGSSLAQTLDADFDAFERDIETWSAVIDQRTKFLTTSSTLAVEKTLRRGSRALEFWSSEETRVALFEARKMQVLHTVSPLQSQFDQFWRRERKKGSVDWIFEHPSYETWSGSKRAVLFVVGGLGSGKTVALAHIVGHLSCPSSLPTSPAASTGQTAAPVVAFFFCQPGKDETLSWTTIVDSLVYQIINHLDRKEASPIINQHRDKSWRTEDSVGILKRLAPRSRQYVIVIDALEECSRRDVEEVYETLRNLSAVLAIRLCLSCRHEISPVFRLAEVVVDGDRSPGLEVKLSGDKFQDELEKYINGEVDRRSGVSGLSPELRAQIKSVLAAGAQGMFLWVALQLESLFPRGSWRPKTDSAIVYVLENLPPDLKSYFNRALGTITDRQTGRKLFMIVAGGRRSLSTDEARIALNVSPGDSTCWDPAFMIRKEHASAAFADLSGGLIEVEEEDSHLYYIHHSVQQHLCGHPEDRQDPQSVPGIFQFTDSDAESLLGQICVTYLSLGALAGRLVRTGQEIDGSAAVDTLQSTAVAAGGVPGKIFASVMKKRNKRETARIIDITKTLRDLMLQSQGNPDDIRLFLDYSNEYWVEQTHCWDHAVGNKLLGLVVALIRDPPPHLRPLNKKDATEEEVINIAWALRREHIAMFTALTYDLPGSKFAVKEALEQRLARVAARYRRTRAMLAAFLQRCLDERPPDYPLIRLLLQKGADPEALLQLPQNPDALARTPFDVAVSIASKNPSDTDRRRMARGLLRLKERPCTRDLHFVIEMGWVDEVEEVLGRKGDTYSYLHLAGDKHDGQLSLGVAIDSLHGEALCGMINMLLRYQAFPWDTYQSRSGQVVDALIHSIIVSKPEAVREILKFRRRLPATSQRFALNYELSGRSPLRTAMEYCPEVIEQLVGDGANPSFFGDRGTASPLARAIRDGDLKMIQALLETCPNEDWLGTAFRSAIAANSRDVVEFMVRPRPGPITGTKRMFISRLVGTIPPRWAVQLAAQQGYTDIIAILADAGAQLWFEATGSPQQSDKQPLLIAVQRQHFLAAKLILERSGVLREQPLPRDWDEVTATTRVACFRDGSREALELGTLLAFEGRYLAAAPVAAKINE